MSRSMKTRRIGNSASAWMSASSSRFTSAVPGTTGSRPSSSRNHSIATTIESRMLQPLISKLIIRPALRAFGRETAFEQTVASDFMTRGVLRVGFRPSFEREVSCPLNATAGARPRSPAGGLAGGREEMAEREGEEEEDAAAHGDEPRVQEPERRPSEGLEVSPQTADQHVREEQVQVEDADHQTGDRARRGPGVEGQPHGIEQRVSQVVHQVEPDTPGEWDLLAGDRRLHAARGEEERRERGDGGAEGELDDLVGFAVPPAPPAPERHDSQEHPGRDDGVDREEPGHGCLESEE